MRSLAFYNLLSHHEEEPGIPYPHDAPLIERIYYWLLHVRHPLVFWCHLAMVVLLLMVLATVTAGTIGQIVFYLAAINLYVTSGIYHALRPSRTEPSLMRFLDQTAICWFILAVAVPFIYTNVLAVSLLSVLAVYSMWRKYHEHPSQWRSGSSYCLFLGIVTSLLILTVGRDALGAPLFSEMSVRIGLEIALFTTALHIYKHRKLRLHEKYWRAVDSKHFVIGMAVLLHIQTIELYPVF